MRPAPLTLLALLGLALALPGCAIFSDEPHYRGIAVTQQQLSQLTPGVSTEADAQALLGPPTFVEQFDPNNWVYLSQITKMRIGQTEGIVKQHAVVLNFNNNGALQGISQKSLKNRVNVAMDPAQTPVPGGRAGFIQQLIGGVGSFNPLGGSGLGSGGATGAGGLGSGVIGHAGNASSTP